MLRNLQAGTRRGMVRLQKWGGVSPLSDRLQNWGGRISISRIDRRSFPENVPRVFVVQFVSDAFVGEADELSERSMWPTIAARQRWDEAADRGLRMAIEGSKIDRLRRVAGRAEGDTASGAKSREIVE
jgi:hypothetical protein